jgi:hypothetical protein
MEIENILHDAQECARIIRESKPSSFSSSDENIFNVRLVLSNIMLCGNYDSLLKEFSRKLDNHHLEKENEIVFSMLLLFYFILQVAFSQKDGIDVVTKCLNEDYMSFSFYYDYYHIFFNKVLFKFRAYYFSVCSQFSNPVNKQLISIILLFLCSKYYIFSNYFEIINLLDIRSLL